MPPEINSDVDFFTENESEIEIKPVDDGFLTSDVEKYRKVFAMDTETESELDVQKTSRGDSYKRKYSCETCSESFRRKTQLDRHVFKHNGIVSRLF